MPDRSLHPFSWADNGKTLITLEAFNSFDIGAISTDGDHKWRALLNEKYAELKPRISPDGHWLAYVSDESGQDEVYVRPFPEVDKRRTKISQSGGDSPLWSSDGRELFYRAGDTVVAVSVKTGTTFSHDAPRKLFQDKYIKGIEIGGFLEWDVHPDGKRFLMIKESAPESASGGPRRINIVLNWFEELKRLVPKK
jgi:eukaryotic-like serine/threonine-protein kinase